MIKELSVFENSDINEIALKLEKGSVVDESVASRLDAINVLLDKALK